MTETLVFVLMVPNTLTPTICRQFEIPAIFLPPPPTPRELQTTLFKAPFNEKVQLLSQASFTQLHPRAAAPSDLQVVLLEWNFCSRRLGFDSNPGSSSTSP